MTPVHQSIWMIRQDKAKVRKEKRKANARFQAKVAGKPILPKRKAVRAALDSVCSLIVRMRDKKIAGGYCLVCVAKKRLGMIPNRGMNPIGLAYHVVSRGKEAVRWALENLVGACRVCNRWEQLTRYQNPDLVRRVHAALVGEDVLRGIEESARAGAKFSIPDLRDLLSARKSMLAGVASMETVYGRKA